MSQTDIGRESNGFFSSFVTHPASVGETYFQHLAFAMRFSGKLFCAGSAALIHAFLPAFFETTASRLIKEMVSEMENRHSADH